MRFMKTLVVLALLLCVGCGNKIDGKIAEMEGKPPATDVKSAKALYDEVVNLIRWHEDPTHEKMSPTQVARVEALKKRRFDEGVALGGEQAMSSVSETLGKIGAELKSIDIGKKVGEVKDWALGVNDPRFKKFGCKDENGNEVDVTKEGASKLCR